VSLVGIIANPSAGKDIRRLVAHGRVVTTQEKINVLRRVLLALDAVGVERALVMPDRSMLGLRALEEISIALRMELLDMPVRGTEDDSTRAAALMAERGAGCIVTLGGDGTNRAVALGCGTVPLAPISTGTNNVFPAMVEGTTAGLAAGLLALGVGGNRIARSLVVGVVIAIVVGVALGFEWPNQAFAAVGESARLNVEAGVRPLVVGLLVGALVGVLLGFAAAIRIGSSGGRFAAIVGLAIVGALGGAFSAITFGSRVGAAVGITIGYLTWIVLMGVEVARSGVDVEGLKERFYPSQTIDTGKETLEWLQKRMPPGIGS